MITKTIREVIPNVVEIEYRFFGVLVFKKSVDAKTIRSGFVGQLN